MKHADALTVAQTMVKYIQPACTRVAIAGSLSRGKPDVKDIEIVAIPNLTPLPPPRAVFGQPRPQWHKTMLDKLLFEWCLDGGMRPIKSGEKYKQFEIIIPHGTAASDGTVILKESVEPIRINLDLFLVTPPAEWGVQMVIRTGPAEFSHWCVTRRRNGGALPNMYRVQDGAVWIGDREEKNPDPSTKLSMPEEIDFLNLLDLGWIEPGEREARWRK